MGNRLNLLFLVCVVVTLTSGSAYSDTKLPAPSRTVFKCQVAGKSVYSDSPCLGAEKINVTPTRGLNKSTGHELVGSDVRIEKQRENMAEAIKPITGMNAKQVETFGRRMKLSAEDQKECKALDRQISVAEQDEKQSKPANLAQSQTELLTLRQHYRDLRC